MSAQNHRENEMFNQRSKLVTAIRIGALAIAMSALACSTDTTIIQSSCGEGTELVDGNCVANEAADSQVVDDGSLADSHADTGKVEPDGEVLDSSITDTVAPEDTSDSVVVIDATDVADTATTIDTAVVTDTADASADISLDAGPEASLDSAADVATDTSTDVATDSSTETLIDSGDNDPCPPAALAVDCSGECSLAYKGYCPQVACFNPTKVSEAPHYVINNLARLPMVIRTPDHPPTDPNCQPRCGLGNTTYGIAFRIASTDPIPEGIRVRVGAPWKIYHYDRANPHCFTTDAEYGSCVVTKMPTYAAEFLVATDTIDAPARNITIENLPVGSPHCP